jgi:hypothetical protein
VKQRPAVKEPNASFVIGAKKETILGKPFCRPFQRSERSWPEWRSSMSVADFARFQADAANMTDEELIDTWNTASDQETENLSPSLQAVVDEMSRRNIPF